MRGKVYKGSVVSDELDRKRPQMAGLPGGRGPVDGLREGAGLGSLGSRDTRPPEATRFLETTLGFLSYTDLAPLPTERVANLRPYPVLPSGLKLV